MKPEKLADAKDATARGELRHLIAWADATAKDSAIPINDASNLRAASRYLRATLAAYVSLHNDEMPKRAKPRVSRRPAEPNPRDVAILGGDPSL